MKMSTMEKINYALVAMSFAVAAYVYPSLPEKVASHWDTAGNVNGYVGSFWGAFLLPFLALAMMLVFSTVVRIDPKKKNIEKFKKTFDTFVTVLLSFLFYMYGLTIAWAFGYRFDMGQVMAPGMALVFLAVAFLIRNAEPNWSIGIRTPWTLSNDEVWRKTQDFSAKLFVAAAVLCFLGVILPRFSFWLVFVPVVSAAVASVVYSYLIFIKNK